MDAAATELLDRLRAGDRAAFDGLFELYAGRLAAVAKRHLSRRLAARADGADVVQSAFRTFYRRNAAGRLRVANSRHLWLLLVRITVLKARAKGRHHAAAARDAAAEVGDGWLAEVA